MPTARSASASWRGCAPRSSTARSCDWCCRRRAPQDGDLVRIAVRPVALRGREALSVVSSHARRDDTRNLGAVEALALVDARLGPVFAHAHLQRRRWRAGAAAQPQGPLGAGAPGAGRALGRAGRRAAGARPAAAGAGPAVAAAPPHDRAKRRWVDIGRPWLAALGVTDAEGRLVPAMARKWKQINKFVEVFDHAWREAAPRLDRPGAGGRLRRRQGLPHLRDRRPPDAHARPARRGHRRRAARRPGGAGRSRGAPARRARGCISSRATCARTRPRRST